MPSCVNAKIINMRKADILKAARELFQKHGLRRVSVEEISRNAEVSKMTFYKHFKNKTDIAIRVLDIITAESFRDFNEIAGSDMTFHEKIAAMTKLKLKSLAALGDEFLKDFVDPKYELHYYVEDIKRQAREWTINFFKRAQEDGEIRKDLNLKLVFAYLTEVQKMAFASKEMLQACPDHGERVAELSKLFFGGVMNFENNMD